MSETIKEIAETFVDIKQSYVDEKLREFFEVDHVEVNIDNICLFAAKTVEEYNNKAEKKLKGVQKFEAAVELAKSVVERSMAFVPEDLRRSVTKNIYHNVDAIGQTIQFIVDISNNPNIVNVGKWVENTKKKVRNAITGEGEGDETPKRGLFSRCLGCFRSSDKPKEESEESKEEESPVEESEVVVEEKEESKEEAPKPPSKKELKKEREAEKLRKRLELLSMTEEEKAERRKEEREAVEKKKKEEREAVEQKKREKKEAIEKKKKEKEEAKKEAKKEKLLKKIEKLNETPKEEAEEPKGEENIETDSKQEVVEDEQKEN